MEIEKTQKEELYSKPTEKRHPHFKNKPPILGKTPFLKIPEPPSRSPPAFNVKFSNDLNFIAEFNLADTAQP